MRSVRKAICSSLNTLDRSSGETGLIRAAGDPRLHGVSFAGAAELLHEIHQASGQQRADDALGGRTAAGSSG
jgi:hypothetical protein